MIENALAILGDTGDAVAEKLLAEGCFGAHNCDSCPMYQYLSRYSDEVLGVGFYNVRTRFGNFQLPEAVVEFVARYTFGRYQYLRTS